MIIGVPKEIKDREFRVAITPGGAETLSHHGHRLLVESGAGVASGFADEQYVAAGATIVATAEEAWNEAEMVVKVKEPLSAEYRYLRSDLTLFTYLHLAAEAEVTRELLANRVTAIAYETVQAENGSLPLLTPMSEVAGRMAVQLGAHYLEIGQGGRGVLLGGVPGVRPASVVIIGGGTGGTNAAQIALGMGARVTLIDINIERLRYLDDVLHGRLTTMASNKRTIAEAVRRAEVLIGAVLLPGAKAPLLVTEEHVSTMAAGSVVIDVAVDQGGCIETVRPTSHSQPTYQRYGVIHYAVPNMPGAVPRTSTYALSNATLPYIQRLADLGVVPALVADRSLRQGLNTYRGEITHAAVAKALKLTHVDAESALAT